MKKQKTPLLFKEGPGVVEENDRMYFITLFLLWEDSFFEPQKLSGI